ncbi:MAG: phosphodiester glycosidase family protein [Eubacteriales bacterium]
MKKIIVILLIIVIIALPIYLVYSNQSTEDDFYTQLNDFNILLKEQQYEQAKGMYSNASNTLKANYNISLEEHAGNLITEAKKAGSTQAALDLLYAYTEIGFTSSSIESEITHYEALLQSNYIFQKGLDFYNNQDYENAIDCFKDVLEYDENYSTAQEYINTYQSYNLAWRQAKDENLYGRSPEPNSVAFKSNNMYIPYEFDNSVAILKINSSTYSILSFPIASSKNESRISNINIVGDYIFFLLEQRNHNTESGTQTGVYRISINGENLTKITDCDYTYLITYQDKFYAVSPSKGLIAADNYFTSEEVLVETEDDIIDVHMVDDGIYYTIDQKDSDINIHYFYNGETSEAIDEDVNMHYYDYEQGKIIYYDINAVHEYFYYYKSPNKNQIFAGDMYKFYGMLNNNLIFTYTGDYQQECIRVKSIDTYITSYKADQREISYVPMGICYETGYILLKSEDGISLTKENMRIEQNLTLPHLNSSVLSENQKNITEVDTESYYSTQAQTKEYENRWVYSDENINISTEKVYLEELESTVYISHVYTKDFLWLKSNEISRLQKPSDADEDMAWSMAGSAYNAKPEFINEDRGILSQDVCIYNVDGMMIAYRASNVIPAEKVLAAEVLHVFSGGTILLENYSITNDCQKDGGKTDGRSAIGMVEPGHYVVIVSEKPTNKNKGLSLYSMARLFEEEKCQSAYCFDNDYLYADAFSENIYEKLIKNEDLRRYNQILFYKKD